MKNGEGRKECVVYLRLCPALSRIGRKEKERREE